MPKSTTSTPAGSGAAREPVGERDAEPVVAEEDVADPGHQHAPLRRGAARLGGQRLDLGRGEEEAMAEAAGGAEVAAGVVLHGDHQVDGALRVLLDRVHDGDPAVQREVEDVARPAAGRRRTRLPRRTSTPPISTASGPKRSSASQPLIAAPSRTRGWRRAGA